MNKKLTSHICRYCNKPISGRHHRANVYCNTTCYLAAKNAASIARLRSGKCKSDGTRRRLLCVLYGPKCSICGITEWAGKPVPLVMDHIDGNPIDNKLDNLRLVCCNCDAQLPTYKGRNRGHGRIWRKQRYHDGKSY